MYQAQISGVRINDRQIMEWTKRLSNVITQINTGDEKLGLGPKLTINEEPMTFTLIL